MQRSNEDRIQKSELKNFLKGQLQVGGKELYKEFPGKDINLDKCGARDMFDVDGTKGFPFYVMNVHNLRENYTRIPKHEDALENGHLEKLDATSPDLATTFFISQNWETPTNLNKHGVSPEWREGLKKGSRVRINEDLGSGIWRIKDMETIRGRRSRDVDLVHLRRVEFRENIETPAEEFPAAPGFEREENLIWVNKDTLLPLVSHPDNDRNTKLRFLKQLPEHLKLVDETTDDKDIKSLRKHCWIWLDEFSIPQETTEEAVEKRGKALKSIPYYTTLASRIIPLVRDQEKWEEVYNEKPTMIKYGDERVACGDIQTYKTRGWCRLELVSALCPKQFVDKKTYKPGPVGLRYYYHTEPRKAPTPWDGLNDADAQAPERFHGAELMRNIKEGNMLLTGENALLDPLGADVCFTDCTKAKEDDKIILYEDTDRSDIEPVLDQIVMKYMEYWKSGSTEWSLTLSIGELPSWLVARGYWLEWLHHSRRREAHQGDFFCCKKEEAKTNEDDHDNEETIRDELERRKKKKEDIMKDITALIMGTNSNIVPFPIVDSDTKEACEEIRAERNSPPCFSFLDKTLKEILTDENGLNIKEDLVGPILSEVAHLLNFKYKCPGAEGGEHWIHTPDIKLGHIVKKVNYVAAHSVSEGMQFWTKKERFEDGEDCEEEVEEQINIADDEDEEVIMDLDLSNNFFCLFGSPVGSRDFESNISGEV